MSLVIVRRAGAALLAGLGLAISSVALAQEPSVSPAEMPFTPELGMPGKDVIWLPTADGLLTAMLDAAQVAPGDLVIDLGSGDGRIPIAAARTFGARARGIEFNPDLVALSRENAAKAGVADKVDFIEGDIFKVDWSMADVLTLYLLPELNLQIREDILKMKPGTRVVSNAFPMGDWTPDRVLTVDHRRAYFWVVPADFSGRWRLKLDGRRAGVLRIDQKHQKIIAASAQASGGKMTIADAVVRGPEIAFTLQRSTETLRVQARLEAGALRGVATAADGRAVHMTALRSPSRP